MSNFMRTRAQSPQASANFVSMSGCQLFTRNFTGATLVIDTTNVVVNDFSFNKVLSAGVLLRDMGRSLTIFDTLSNGRTVKLAILREVQIVSGSSTEGVSDTTAYLTPVWADYSPETTTIYDAPSDTNGFVVRVARSG